MKEIHVVEDCHRVSRTTSGALTIDCHLHEHQVIKGRGTSGRTTRLVRWRCRALSSMGSSKSSMPCSTVVLPGRCLTTVPLQGSGGNRVHRHGNNGETPHSRGTHAAC